MKKILIIDDEPVYAEWLFEFVENLDGTYQTYSNYGDALKAIGNGVKFDLIVVDMNIPSDGTHRRHNGPLYDKYPGLAFARDARDLGYPPKSVIIYTVHIDEEIKEIADTLGVQYIIKSRPKILKKAITDIFLQK